MGRWKPSRWKRSDANFDVNVIGLLETTKALLPHFRANKDGIIINISSVGGKVTFPLGMLYHGTKFAVEGLSESLSFEMEAIGVKVKIIEPGAIKTDFLGRSFDFNQDKSMVEYQQMIDKLFTAFDAFMAAGSEPIVVAEVIYTAATDGTNQLRYPAGADARALLEQRKAQDDATFLQGIKKQFGLA